MHELILQNKFFSAYRIADGVTHITGMARECCYLIEGTDRALLVDGLTGVGSLRAFVRELTDLPVLIAVTHGHMDHTGIAWESDSIYIHPDDMPLLYPAGNTGKQSRMDYVNLFIRFGLPCRTKPMETDFSDEHPVKTLPILDGDVFDLGGVQLQVISVPGHTRGTVVFLDRTHRLLFGGDACNANTLLNLACSTSITEYKASLQHLSSFADDFNVLWNGHDHAAISKQSIFDGIALCDRILSRTDAAIEKDDPFGGRSLMASKEGEYLCNIVYKEETIYEKARPTL